MSRVNVRRSARGHKSGEAQEGIDALKQIASGKFDFVFLDYNMPGLNGVAP